MNDLTTRRYDLHERSSKERIHGGNLVRQLLLAVALIGVGLGLLILFS